MPFKALSVAVLAALLVPLTSSPEAAAQYRERAGETRTAPNGMDRERTGDRSSRGERRRDSQSGTPRRRRTDSDRDRQRRSESDRDRRRTDSDRDRRRRADRRDTRRRYDRDRERRWHRDRPRTSRRIYVPRRWSHRHRPHYRHLRDRRYGRVWWCGSGCRIALLFGFSVWALDTILSDDSSYSFPVWEALEYNRTGETTLWESSWGYVEFTPTRTFTRRFRGRLRHCRDFLRVVVRADRRERRFEGTACRNPRGVWWIVASRRVYG